MSESAPADVAQAALDAVVADWARTYQTNRTLLTFDAFLGLVAQYPRRFARSSAQYLLDAIGHWGTTTVETGAGPRTRWRVFDAPFDGGEERVVGQEDAQQRLVTLLHNFVNERRINRLLLLHGPNGSAKSSFVSCLMRALEAYSATEDGAMYRFNWVFPARISEGGRLGFGAEARQGSYESFALLEDAAVDARLAAEHNDNPLFLLPADARMRLLETSLGPDAGFTLSDHIRKGDLGQRSRAVFDALVAAYRGDLRKVYRHVQVERFEVSRRYRRAAVTVEPQLRVDASVRQLTADRSLNALPAALQTQTLFETFGPLVEGNRGIIEYNDLLKRPMEAFKYLLATSEKGTVALDHGEMRLDAVLIATSNEIYLESFKESPEWASYKGRFELIRMPYLLDWRAEQRIYDDLLATVSVARPVAPHTTRVLALWAVLTRLRRPTVSRYPQKLQSVISALTPLDKALLYADGTVPRGLQADQAALLRANAVALMAEGAEDLAYEGRTGASAREMKTVLLTALHGAARHLSPLGVFAELERLVRDRSVYEWLRTDPEGDYRRPEAFVNVVREHWLDLVEREVRQATQLVDETEYRRVFERYITHANYWLRGEKFVDAHSGQRLEPDDAMMADIEKTIGRTEEPRAFRSQLLSQIAAFRIDNPDAPVDYERIFPRAIERLRETWYQAHRKEVARLCQQLLRAGQTDAGGLNSSEVAAAEATLARLIAEAGYTRETAMEAVATLVTGRFAALLT